MTTRLLRRALSLCLYASLGVDAGCGSDHGPDVLDTFPDRPRSGPAAAGNGDGGLSPAPPQTSPGPSIPRTGTFAAVFDDLPMQIHPDNADRLGTVLLLDNATQAIQHVLLVARGDDGTEIERYETDVVPSAPVQMASFGPGRSGLFTGKTLGRRFSIDVHGRVAATALVARLSATPAAPLQVTSVSASLPSSEGPELVLPQMPVGGLFDARAYIANAGDAAARGVANLSCRSGRVFDTPVALPAHGAMELAPRDGVGSDSCAVRIRAEGNARFVATTYWATGGGAASLAAFVSFGAGVPSAELGASRVMMNRSGFHSGLTVYNAGTAETDVELAFLFPARSGADHRSFSVTERVAPGAVMTRYLGQPLETAGGAIPIPDASEGAAAGDGTVRIRTLAVAGQPAQGIVANVSSDNRAQGGAWTMLAPALTARRQVVFPVHNRHAPEWLASLAGTGAVIASGLSVHSASTSASTCTVTYRFAGAQHVTTMELAPLATAHHFLPDVMVDGAPLPSGTVGSAVVDCTAAVTVESSARISDAAALGTWLAGDGMWGVPAVARDEP